jgi:hypothetical protein
MFPINLLDPSLDIFYISVNFLSKSPSRYP